MFLARPTSQKKAGESRGKNAGSDDPGLNKRLYCCIETLRRELRLCIFVPGRVCVLKSRVGRATLWTGLSGEDVTVSATDEKREKGAQNRRLGVSQHWRAAEAE